MQKYESYREVRTQLVEIFDKAVSFSVMKQNVLDVIMRLDETIGDVD